MARSHLQVVRDTHASKFGSAVLFVILSFSYDNIIFLVKNYIKKNNKYKRVSIVVFFFSWVMSKKKIIVSQKIKKFATPLVTRNVSNRTQILKQ